MIIKQQNVKVALAVPSGDIVGESAVWDDRRQALFWVDIVGKRLHRWHPSENRLVTRPAPDFATSVGLREDDGAIVGLRKSIVLWDLEADFEFFSRLEAEPDGNRLNEGVVGPDGGFWVGTMQDNLQEDGSPRTMDRASGALYRVSPEGEVMRLLDATIGISNTCAWLPDGRFVSADTLENVLYAYSFGERGLSERQVFAGPFGRGMPDGSCVDSEGGLWNCRVGGGACVVRYLPSGTIDRVVELPCHSPTSCCFGGARLETLYVTSARFGLDRDHLDAHPQEGSVFALQPGVRGALSYRFPAPNSLRL